ncbi:YjbH domain-containing protein [Paraferrimonas sp. SM1919]|uniref:YjbH domain-containing protein n=1 Tax=Paraferrimonas sp. SM1919 TaxID=2662263 RepID=UPI0013D4DB17|nr:YjbH domain-containing protein [Paraferrimonas sp. SM1919]
MRFSVLTLAIISSLSPQAVANPSIKQSFSQTGFSGNLRTPNAHTINYGDINFAINFENNVDHQVGYGRGAHNSLLLGVGLLPGVELLAQNTFKRFNGVGTYHSGAGSDLSFSLKLSSVGWFPESPWQVAIGQQDFGGIANHHDNTYGVVSYDWQALRLSAGYGRQSSFDTVDHAGGNNQMGPDYLNGAFGGVEWQAYEWLNLKSDYDGTGFNAGLVLSAPAQWLPKGWNSQFILQGYSNSNTFNRDNAWVGLQFGLPLGGSNELPLTTRKQYPSTTVKPPSRNQQLVQTKDYSPAPNANQPLPTQVAIVKDKAAVAPTTLQQQQQQIVAALVEHGFENIKINHNSERLELAYENFIYLHNELDGLQQVLKIVNKYYHGAYDIYMLNNQIPVLLVREQISHNNSQAPIATQYISYDVSHYYDQVAWGDDFENSGTFVPRVNFSPGLITSLGTEWGVFDYSLSLQTAMSIDLWKGGTVDVRHNLPVAQSDDVGPFPWYPVPEQKNRVNRILLHQAWALPQNIFTQFSGGLVYGDFVGVFNETRWQSPQGHHKFSFRGGQFRHQDTDFKAEPKLFYYRYYRPEFDWALELHSGEYWYGDRGYGAKSIHWFGDVATTIEYHKTEDASYAGMYFSFPISFGKSMTAKRGYQITGVDEWRHGYYTDISSQGNWLAPTAKAEPWLQHSLTKRYFNRDRMSAAYIEAHLDRLNDD